MLSFTSNNTPKGQARQLARHYPTGRVWSNTFNTGTNLGKMVYSLAQEWLRSEAFAAVCVDELYIEKTEGLLEQWEASVGIPDGIFSTDVDLVTRRLQVLQKLIDFGGAQTKQDFLDIAVLFGFLDVTIRSGSVSLFPLSFPVIFFSGDGKAARHTIFVNLPNSQYVFPLAFPIQFAASSGLVLEGIFNSLVPANVEVIFLFGEA